MTAGLSVREELAFARGWLREHDDAHVQAVTTVLVDQGEPVADAYDITLLVLAAQLMVADGHRLTPLPRALEGAPR